MEKKIVLSLRYISRGLAKLIVGGHWQLADMGT